MILAGSPSMPSQHSLFTEKEHFVVKYEQESKVAPEPTCSLDRKLRELKTEMVKLMHSDVLLWKQLKALDDVITKLQADFEITTLGRDRLGSSTSSSTDPDSYVSAESDIDDDTDEGVDNSDLVVSEKCKHLLNESYKSDLDLHVTKQVCYTNTLSLQTRNCVGESKTTRYPKRKLRDTSAEYKGTAVERWLHNPCFIIHFSSDSIHRRKSKDILRNTHKLVINMDEHDTVRSYENKVTLLDGDMSQFKSSLRVLGSIRMQNRIFDPHLTKWRPFGIALLQAIDAHIAPTSLSGIKPRPRLRTQNHTSENFDSTYFVIGNFTIQGHLNKIYAPECKIKVGESKKQVNNTSSYSTNEDCHKVNSDWGNKETHDLEESLVKTNDEPNIKNINQTEDVEYERSILSKYDIPRSLRNTEYGSKLLKVYENTRCDFNDTGLPGKTADESNNDAEDPCCPVNTENYYKGTGNKASSTESYEHTVNTAFEAIAKHSVEEVQEEKSELPKHAVSTDNEDTAQAFNNEEFKCTVNTVKSDIVCDYTRDLNSADNENDSGEPEHTDKDSESEESDMDSFSPSYLRMENGLITCRILSPMLQREIQNTVVMQEDLEFLVITDGRVTFSPHVRDSDANDSYFIARLFEDDKTSLSSDEDSNYINKLLDEQVTDRGDDSAKSFYIRNLFEMPLKDKVKK